MSFDIASFTDGLLAKYSDTLRTSLPNVEFVLEENSSGAAGSSQSSLFLVGKYALIEVKFVLDDYRRKDQTVNMELLIAKASVELSKSVIETARSKQKELGEHQLRVLHRKLPGSAMQGGRTFLSKNDEYVALRAQFWYEQVSQCQVRTEWALAHSHFPLSEEAAAVLAAMRAGRVLVGSIGDFDRPFRLERDGTWDNVTFSIAQELIKAGKITQTADRGNGQTEYSAVLL